MYGFSFYAKNIDVDKRQVLVALVSDGEILAESKLKVQGKTWSKYTAIFAPKKASEHAQLVIIPQKKGSTAVDMVSLFPEDTYKGHGLRKDLAEAIAALHPKFVRFPGGCMSHGNGIDNIYHWNASVGPWQDRKPDMNIWEYHQTRGLGFYEYFQFCEDIGAEPVPVLAAGVPCPNSPVGANGLQGQQGGIPMADMPAYIQELLDMIDWANGNPATSKWAKMRADAGHPAPFNLKYIGIGNEDMASTTFKERYLMICKAIKAQCPNIKIIGTAGSWHYPQSDYIEGWNIAKQNKDVIDLVDEHYYESTGWFLHHQDYYNDYDRKAPKVYLGEYANVSRKANNVESALSEAVWLCNVERNGDVVDMASYAPLLCNKNHHQWSPDMIYFDNTMVTESPSYITQQLFSLYSGDEYIASKIAINDKLKYRVASSVVRDSRTGNVYLKIVNVLPVSLTLKIEGLQVKEGSDIHGFGGDLLKTEAAEVTEKAGSTIYLPPYSFRVIELK
jgi:alpha-L-arabinofuranosidase